MMLVVPVYRRKANKESPRDSLGGPIKKYYDESVDDVTMSNNAPHLGEQ